MIGNAFLPHLYFLERILVAEVIHVKNLSLTLCQVSTDICGLLGAVGYRTDEGSTTATRISTRGVNGQALTPVHQDLDEEVEQKILAVGRTFPYLLTSLQKLSKLSASETLQGQVVYNYIKILHSLLERICSIAAVSVGKSQENTPSSTMAKPSYKEESKPVATPANKRPAMLPNLTKLCELLVSMVACLDLTKKNHKDIVEGFLYHLMKRLGDGLEYFVFGAHGHGISDEHMNNRQARRDPGPMSVKAAAAGRATMEAQAPYLIWILERVRHAGSRNVRSTTSIQTTDDAQGQPTTTPPSASVAAFYRNSRARLQHTLLRSVFGAQVASEFIPALDPPQAPSTDELAAALGSDFETTEVRDWYKLEVWRLVGWDVLRGHIAW